MEVLEVKAEEPKMSDEMNHLLDQQQQIKNWMQEVKDRIHSLETNYLEDTPMGNIVRGWEQSKIFATRSRKISDKERLFSNSSYQVWLDVKNKPVEETKADEASKETAGFVQKKKMRRSNSRKDTTELAMMSLEKVGNATSSAVPASTAN